MLKGRLVEAGLWSFVAMALGQGCAGGDDGARPTRHGAAAGTGGVPATAPPALPPWAGEAGEGGAAAFDPNLSDECRTICRREAQRHCDFDTADGGAAGASNPDVPPSQPDCAEGWCQSDELYRGGTCPREWAALIKCMAESPIGSVSCVPGGWSWTGCEAEDTAYGRCSRPFP